MDTPASAEANFVERVRVHREKVANLVQHYQRCKQADGISLGLQKDTSNLFRHRGKKRRLIDVRAFNQVLVVDEKHCLAEVEGMTTYADLVDETLRWGLLPTVVPELKSITIGGALSGIGVESSSFRYGLVNETITEIEILLGDGRVVVATANNEYKDLFYAFPNSYGTLGYALKVTVKLIRTKPYVKLTHYKFSDPEAYFTAQTQACLQNHEAGPVAYVDGTIFAKDELVLTQAEFVDEPPFVSNYQFMNIYYRSLQTKDTDYLTTLDYIWRWDPDWFWCSKVFYMQNRVLRFLLGKWMLKSTSYWKLMQFAHRNPIIKRVAKWFGQRTESVIQDVAIPVEQALSFFHFFVRNIGISPIWNCPIIPGDQADRYTLFALNPKQLYVNFGFWDMVPSDQEMGFYNRMVERKVHDLQGMKSLYSNAYYSKEEFWAIYDRTKYRALKAKYDSEGVLGNIYSKCTERNMSS